MARISTYPLDESIQGTDKWIGSDSVTKNATKNFTAEKVAQYLNSSGVIESQTLRYMYQDKYGQEPRLMGTISFNPVRGESVPFSSIDTFLLSAYAKPTKDVHTFYSEPLIGAVVLITNATNVSNWALYYWNSSTQDIDEPLFYNIGLTFISGDGGLFDRNDYIISMFSSGGGGSGNVSGFGTTNKVSKWINPNTISDSILSDDGASVWNNGGSGIVSNTAFGQDSLISNTTGTWNSTLGFEALKNNTTGRSNTAIGFQTMFSNITGNDNIALGMQSLYFNTTGFNNTAIGFGALSVNTTGVTNTAIGFQAAAYNGAGDDNIAIGYRANYGNVGLVSNGGGNVAIGSLSLITNYGNDNIAIGFQSLSTNTTGSGNVALGRSTQSGNFSNSIILGFTAAATGNNQFVVGSSIRNAGIVNSNGLLIGNNSSWNVKVNGTDYNIPVAATSSLARLQIRGSSTTSSTTALLVQNGASTPLLSVLDNSNVGIRTDTPVGKLDVRTTDSFGAAIFFNNDDSSSPFWLKRANNGGVAVNTFSSNGTIDIPTDRDSIGYLSRFTGQAYIDTAFRPLARMEYYITSTPTVGNAPTGIRFLTVKGGDATYNLNERMGITDDGNVQIGESLSNNRNSKLLVKGTSTTSSTTALLIQNSASSPLFKVLDNGVIMAQNMPTSSAGLAAGSLWSDGGTIKIV